MSRYMFIRRWRRLLLVLLCLLCSLLLGLLPAAPQLREEHHDVGRVGLRTPKKFCGVRREGSLFEVSLPKTRFDVWQVTRSRPELYAWLRWSRCPDTLMVAERLAGEKPSRYYDVIDEGAV